METIRVIPVDGAPRVDPTTLDHLSGIEASTVRLTPFVQRLLDEGKFIRAKEETPAPAPAKK